MVGHIRRTSFYNHGRQRSRSLRQRVAKHGYAGDTAIIKPETFVEISTLWVTEDASQSRTFDGTMQDALGWARIIHNYLTVANVNAFVFWRIDGEGTNPGNTALSDASGTPALRAYVVGNWSKFVRPGWKRIGPDRFARKSTGHSFHGAERRGCDRSGQ